MCRQFLKLSARQPVSRVLSFKSVIYLGLNSHLTSSNQPRWLTKNCFRLKAMPSLFGLAPGGVFHAFFVTKKTGALLPHLFTLALIRRSVLCGTIPEVTLARCYLAPCSYRARTFLSCLLTKATNQLSGNKVNKQKKLINQGF